MSLGLICAAVTTAVHADDQSFNTAADHLVQLQVLQSLNQIAVSLTHILTYNHKVVLDQDYNTIINDLNLSKIPDADIISLLQELMDLLTSSKIQEHERAYLSRSYEKNVQEELRRRLRKRVLETDLLFNHYMRVLSAIVNAGSFYFNYRGRMDDYKKEREEAAWKIEAATLQGLNNLYKNLLKYSWHLMRPKYTSYLVTNSSPSEEKTFEPLAKESVMRKEGQRAKGHGEDGQVLWFTKERLVLNGESFPWSDEGIRF